MLPFQSRLRQLIDGDDAISLLPEQYDRVKASTRNKRQAIIEQISMLDHDVHELTESMLSAMLQAGAGAVPCHTLLSALPSFRVPSLTAMYLGLNSRLYIEH